MKKLFLLLILLTSINSKASVDLFFTLHSEEKAISTASDFIRTLLIEDDAKEAYEMIHKDIRLTMPFIVFQELANKLNTLKERYEITHISIS